jgi:hypothetical protein
MARRTGRVDSEAIGYSCCRGVNSPRTWIQTNHTESMHRSIGDLTEGLEYLLDSPVSDGVVEMIAARPGEASVNSCRRPSSTPKSAWLVIAGMRAGPATPKTGVPTGRRNSLS